MSATPSIDIELDNTIAFANRQKDLEIEPRIDELITHEHISDSIPFTAWLIIIGEFCEGFTYYGVLAIMQNYIQFPIPGPGTQQPGVLNQGQQMATLLTTSFFLLCNLTPIAAAIVADQYWGKYKTIFFASFLYLIGLILLVISSIPISIHLGLALPGLLLAMVILAVAVGGVKSTAGPLMAEQYTRTTPFIKG